MKLVKRNYLKFDYLIKSNILKNLFCLIETSFVVRIKNLDNIRLASDEILDLNTCLSANRIFFV